MSGVGDLSNPSYECGVGNSKQTFWARKRNGKKKEQWCFREIACENTMFRMIKRIIAAVEFGETGTSLETDTRRS